MYKLELTSSQVLMMKDMIECDMDLSSHEAPDYDSIDLMQYYLDRAQVLQKVKELVAS